MNADGLVSTGEGLTGYNMFAYCNNDPTLLSDNDGTRPGVGCGPGETEEEVSESCAAMYNGNQNHKYVSSVTNKYHHTTSSGGGNSSSSVSNGGGSSAETYVSTAASIAIGSISRALSQFKNYSMHTNGEGSPYFSEYARYGSAIDGLSIAGCAVSGLFLGWDLQGIWGNNSYSNNQKIVGTGIAAGGFLAGIGVGLLAVSLANCWNPIGWAGLAAAAITYAAVSIAGGMAISSAEEYAYRKEGIS